MKPILNTLLLTFTFSSFSNALSAQSKDDQITELKTYLKKVDSLIINDENSSRIVRTISEGTITSKRARHAKRDTVEESGGFGIYGFKSVVGDSTFKIVYHDNLTKNFYETYYFKNNELIYAQVEYKDEDKDQTLLYRKEVFYTGRDVLKEVKSGKKLSKPLRARLDFDLFERGTQRLIVIKK